MNDNKNNIYIDQLTKIISNIECNKIKNIYFNLQNSEIIIRNLQNIKINKKQEIVKLIKYEIGDHMDLNLKNYIIKYKKIINNKTQSSIQGILFPKKYVDICNSISKNIKIKNKYLYINFDILQKLIDLKFIELSQIKNTKITIIENRENDIIINSIINKTIIDSYCIDKNNNEYFIKQLLYDKDTYYYGINDDFISKLQIQKLSFKKQLIMHNNDNMEDITIRYISSLGMVI